MIKNLLTTICVLFVFGAMAQNGTLNGSFENWNTTMFSEPDYYKTSNSDNQNVVNVLASKSSYSGSTAISLETVVNGNDTVAAYFTNGDPFSGKGGIPYSGMASTGFTGYYKGNIQAGDTAFLLVSYKMGGITISMDTYKFYGNTSSYTLFNFSLNVPPMLSPDTVIIAAVSSNIFAQKGVPGSILYLDSIAFLGINTQPSMLNGDFENWSTHQRTTLVDWYVSGDGVAQTNDAKTGNYAAQLTTNYDSQNNNAYSSIIANNMYSNSTYGYYGRPFTNQVDTLVGWYKYEVNGVDSGNVFLQLMKNGANIHSVSYPFVSNNSYVKFEVPFDAGMTPDTVKMFFSSSSMNTDVTNAGTKLTLDDIYFKSQLLNVTGVVSDVTCNGGKNGVVDVTVTGGSTPYVYSWSNGETTEDLGGLAAGTYTVNITDASNVLSINTFTVSEPSALSLNLTSSDAACGQNDGSVSVSVSGGVTPYSYSWSQSSTDASVSNLGAGVYNVMVTDNNNCSASSAIVVNNTGAPTSTITTVNVYCFGQSTGSAKATVTGGSTPYTYSWSNAATTDSIGGLTAATYAFEVTDNNGCKNFNTATITEPGSAVNVSLLSSTDVLCFGGSNGAATVLATGGTTAYTFTWSNNASGAQVLNLTSGTYTVTVMDANGCSATTTAVITEPSAALATVTGSVADSGYVNVTGGTTPYSYSWSNSSTDAFAKPLSAGKHYVYVSDKNGCSATDSVTIIINSVSLHSNSTKASVYPNPVTNVMYISAPDLVGSHVTISLINVLGEVVWSKDEKQLTSNYKMDVAASLPRGAYLLQIANKLNRSITKFVVE